MGNVRGGFTFDDYLELEAMSPIKHELFDGVVYAMAVDSPEHAAITANIFALLGDALTRQPCRVYTSDLRVRVPKNGLATYPDAMVIAHRIELDPADPKGTTALNPTLLVEVLSPSTESYDRGEKLAHYKRIESLREVMLVAHDDRRVDLWRRTERGWTQIAFREGESVRLESLDCSLPVSEIYFDPLAD